MADRATNDADAISISAGFISKPAQEFRALRWQSKGDCDHETTEGNEGNKAGIDLESLRYLGFLLLGVLPRKPSN